VSEQPSRGRPRAVGIVVLAIAVVALLALIASLSLDNPSDKPVEITGAGEVQGVFGGIHQQGATLGSPDAPVTIDFFNDLQCAFCDDYQLAVVPPLVEDLVRPGQATLVNRHVPRGPRETEGADFGALAAAEQDDQWQFVQLFFINQDKVPPKGVDEDFLSRIAAAVLELDVGKWRSDFQRISEDAGERSALEDDSKLEIDLRLPAEPAVVITGVGGVRKLEEQPTLDQIEAAVAEVD
jgi:protein-disulfide isomerase